MGIPYGSRAAAPLAAEGRLFVQGENVLMAYDSYNGVRLWQREIPGAMRVDISQQTGNMAINAGGLFVATGEKCLRLDPATGTTKASYDLPPAADGKARRWGYVACVGDFLYGSRTADSRNADCLFAIDVPKGELRFSHVGKSIPNSSIAVGDGRVFFIDRQISQQQRQQAIDQQRGGNQKLPQAQQAAAEKALATADIRLAVALDAKTGKVQWQEPVDVTYSGGGKPSYHDAVSAMYHNGVLVLFGVYLDGHYWQQFFAGEFASRRITALAGGDGRFLWSRPVGFRVRPLIIGDTLHAEPWAFDLQTGEPRTRVHPITGQVGQWQFSRPGHHCGCPAASPNCLLFRSYCIAHYDLLGDFGTVHFGAQRPGCWINFIPAAGLLMLPEASAGCMCPFPNMCTIVFQPARQNKGWGCYSASGETTPVERLAVNFGAPGDRNDEAGKLWLGYPRPYSGRLVLPLKIDTTFLPGGGFQRNNSVYTKTAGTDRPWLFASAAGGLRKCVIPLLKKGDGAALYSVRLAFAEPQNSRPGQRVFDIKLQGKTVAKDFDVLEEAGGPDRAVLEQFDGVEVSDNLAIELVPKATKPTAEQMPILQGVEIIRRRVVSLGCTSPSFLLSNLAPKQAGQLRLANLREGPFKGTLRIAAPNGLSLSPAERKITLPSGARQSIPIEAAVAQGVPPGDYTVSLKLIRTDGTVELERSLRLEHLGRRGRMVVHPIEDAYVGQAYPQRNTAKANVLLVDGGDRAMGDKSHNLALVKFHLSTPGKPESVLLRIRNAGNPTGDSGRVCLVDGPWSEGKVTYKTRPKTGRELARLGRVSENQLVQCRLPAELGRKGELSLAIDPTSCDGVDYLSRESGQPAELIVEYVPAK